MKGQMKNMMQQMQKMQAKMKEVQDELANKEVEGSAGGDMVVVRVNGHQEVKDIKISSEVVNPDDIEMLEDLVLAAINDALKESSKLASEDMAKVTGGMDLGNIPGLGGLL